ncbi:MAG: hypothetical protein KF871_18590 [Hydrogenophaga sp.]|uniref:hypothetical protein n=1 Tax=Hydrogenophaga sp. TaxID=1904254 RepID=UPI001D514775|nr:hypothetical protein [Hydrogenophaga sp.]MBX3611907.1 hypothetical protein [Hydrogenophaga sp.]
MHASIPVLEIFNCLGVAQAGMQSPTLSSLAMADGSTQQVQTYTLFAEQVQPMLNAYEQLRQSVYGALVMQTRLKPYMDAVELVIDDNGIRFDTAGIDALAQQHASTDPHNAITDLLDLRRYGSDALNGVGWRFEQTLGDTLTAGSISPEITALLAAQRMGRVGAETGGYLFRRRMHRSQHFGDESRRRLSIGFPKCPTPRGYRRKAPFKMRAFACVGAGEAAGVAFDC